jgi:nitrous oxidase accessory protein
MKKTIILTLIILGFLSTGLNLTLPHASLNEAPNKYSKSLIANTSTIRVPDNYTTIQEAIDKANEGDTIFVRTGIYHEHVTVDKALSLVGENKSNTIIDGGEIETVVDIITNNATIRNFTIQNGKVGIWLWCSHDINLTGNIVSENSPYGIFLGYSHNNVISDNTISSINQYGIYLSYSSNNIFANNTISNNNNGIYLLSSSNNIFANNTISNNRDGICLDASGYNSLTRNTFLSNNDKGTFLYHSSNNVVSDNIILNNNYGIHVGDSDKNVLLNNKALNNQRGIYFYYSRDIILTGNTLTNNLYGILLESSANNEILRNNFVNNIEQSRSIDSVNYWDNGVEGNYWSDYHGTDANRDGIGDTPYHIGENNQDKHPLMAMFLQFNISMENKAYLIDTVCNSTISDFQLHFDSNNKTNAVSFKVNGAGFCRISIPHSLIKPPLTVKVDNNPPLHFKKVYANGTHTWLYFTYILSEHEVTIIHTSPSEQLLWSNWAIFGLAIIIFILFSISVTYYRLFSKQKKVIEAYEREVGSFPVSHEERTRMRFIKDVIERKEKLEKFKKKYGIKIQPASTLDDIMKKLGVQKES